ncbi:hypothetical protein AVEN_6230-1 [Araneus ventricosus]|uniref:Uncharacterized protein n=1 Tax=Araneus ventricosus TaxID=182803 RepID=A0A4Y2GPT6_ARAVE|nr:hypothetical protein AVEN_6230-1 [Araneus ventricosus]
MMVMSEMLQQLRVAPSYNANGGPVFGGYCQRNKMEHSIKIPLPPLQPPVRQFRADRVQTPGTLFHMLVGLLDVRRGADFMDNVCLTMQNIETRMPSPEDITRMDLLASIPPDLNPMSMCGICLADELQPVNPSYLSTELGVALLR